MTKSLESVIDRVLAEHSDLFDSLAETNILEYDMSHYILQHKEGLAEQVNKLRKPHHELFPPSLQDVYAHQFEEEAFKVIRKAIQDSFQLDPENLLRLTPKLVKKVAPELLHV